MADPIYGRNVHVAFGADAAAEAALTTLTGTGTDDHGIGDIDFPISQEPIQLTGGTGESMRYAPAAKADRSFTFSIRWDDTTRPLFFNQRGYRKVVFGPEGNGTGKTKLTMRVVLGSISHPIDVNGIMRITVPMQVDGDLTVEAFS